MFLFLAFQVESGVRSDCVCVLGMWAQQILE